MPIWGMEPCALCQSCISSTIWHFFYCVLWTRTTAMSGNLVKLIIRGYSWYHELVSGKDKIATSHFPWPHNTVKKIYTYGNNATMIEDKARQNKNEVDNGQKSLRKFWRETARNTRDKNSSSWDSFQRNYKYSQDKGKSRSSAKHQDFLS